MCVLALTTATHALTASHHAHTHTHTQSLRAQHGPDVDQRGGAWATQLALQAAERLERTAVNATSSSPAGLQVSGHVVVLKVVPRDVCFLIRDMMPLKLLVV